MRTNVKQAHDGPIFVLCAARSGSTLLRRALDNHPELACPPEINLASAFETIHFAFASTGASDDGVARERARDLCRRLADETAGEYAKARGKSRWCDKSLPSIDYADSLLEVFPSAQFFCLYRECTDTVASAIEACPWGFNGYGFDPYVRSSPTNFVLPLASYWADKAETLNRFEQAHGNLCHRVRYEDLVQRPLEVMNRAFEFLGCAGLGLDELNGLFRLNRELAVGDYKTRFTQRFETSSVGRGWRVPIELIPPPLQVRIDALLADLSALYAVGTVWEFGSAPRLAVSIALITGEVLVIAVLSDELTPGVHRFSLIVAGVSRSAADRLRGQALICRRIRSQPFWQEIIRKSVYEPVFMDSWRDGRWVYAEYEATWDGKPVVIVGADYLGMRPPWVRIVIAEEHEHGLGVFGVWDSAAYARSVRVAASTTPFGGGVPAIS